MEINKEKLDNFISKLLNEVYETNTFKVNTEKNKKQYYNFFSNELKTAVLLNVNLQETTEEQILEIGEIIENIDKSKKFENLLIINYVKNDEIIYKFVEFIQDKLRIEIDIWDSKTISLYMKQYEHLLNIQPKYATNPDKEINYIPKFKNIEPDLFEENAKKLDIILNSESTLAYINNIYGGGKTAFAHYYISTREFSHCAYINITSDFRIDFISAFINSKLKFDYNNSLNIFKNFNEILDVLNKIEGENVMIIDYNLNLNQFSVFNSIIKKTNWKIIVLTSIKLSNNPAILQLSYPSQTFAKITTKKFNDTTYLSLFPYLKATNFNLSFYTLIIKQLKTNKNITVEKLVSAFKEKDKKIHSFSSYLNFGTLSEDNNEYINTLKYITAIYELNTKELNAFQKNILGLLVCFPNFNLTSKEIALFILIHESKIEYLFDTLLDLEKTGWININNNKISVSTPISIVLHKKLKSSATKYIDLLDDFHDKIIGNEDYNLVFYTIPYAISFLKNISNQNISMSYLAEVLADELMEIGYDNLGLNYFKFATNILEAGLASYNPKEEDLIRMPLLYRLSKDYDKAINFSFYTLDFALYNFEENKELHGKIYQILAILHSDIEDYDNAIFYIENALDIFEEICDINDDIFLYTKDIHLDISNKMKEQTHIVNFNKFIEIFIDNNKTK